MHYHLILTEKCNLKCRYCYEKSLNEFENGLEKKFNFDFSEPSLSQIDVRELKKFIEKDSEAKIIFYGGEPLLNIGILKEVMDNIKIPYRMQTNGILLDKLEKTYLNRIEKILISLDGEEKRTDKNRGNGTYRKVTNNIKKIKKEGYKGELIARMTIAQDCPDLFEQVKNLIKEGFTSIHWQLDLGFYKEDFQHLRIKNFLEEYNKSLKKLLDYWILEMEKGNFIRIYPFVGIVDSLLKKEKTPLRCGAGHSGYAITTSGKIAACPIMNSIRDFQAGTIKSSPLDLRKFTLEECNSCDYQDLCGGRCLYWRKAKLWPNEGNELICDSTKFYIDSIKKILPKIKELIKEEKIKKEDFEYEKYFGPEIIP